MSLDDLGNIGELVGAIAVVASLVYLAVQIRQNNRHLRENTAAVQIAAVNEALGSFSRFREHVIRDPEVASLLRRSAKGLSELNQDEAFRFDYLLSDLFHAYQAVYVRSRNLADWGTWQVSQPRLEYYCGFAGVREWWSTARGGFIEDFVAEVESLHPSIRGAA